MITKPIPRAAMPVVYELRREVKRPKAMPKPWKERFEDDDELTLRWKRKKGQCCPMGLHPDAKSATLLGAFTFPFASHRAVAAFGAWWDDQTFAKAAVDAVWNDELPMRAKPKAKK